MLEHMKKEEAKSLINDLLKHSKHLLICFPVVHHDQHAGDEGNDYETHVDHWDDEEMTEFLSDREIVHHAVGWVSAYFMVKGEL
jgi:hypothetical protein